MFSKQIYTISFLKCTLNSEINNVIQLVLHYLLIFFIPLMSKRQNDVTSGQMTLPTHAGIKMSPCPQLGS